MFGCHFCSIASILIVILLFFVFFKLSTMNMQLVLLVDALLFDVVPAFLLSDAQSAGDVVTKIQPLLLCQVANGLIVVFQLQVTLTQEEVGFHRLAVQTLTRPLCRSVIYYTEAVTHYGFAVAGGSLLVLAAEEQPVTLLLQLLGGGALLRASGHLLHRLRGARLGLLPNPVPRLSGWISDRFQKAASVPAGAQLDQRHDA
uniref:Uncharacterized protein n=1 Tax=Gouania willdenowi TaxID=441366 RepID=A0A8C5N750_GOUWI